MALHTPRLITYDDRMSFAPARGRSEKKKHTCRPFGSQNRETKPTSMSFLVCAGFFSIPRAIHLFLSPSFVFNSLSTLYPFVECVHSIESINQSINFTFTHSFILLPSPLQPFFHLCNQLLPSPLLLLLNKLTNNGYSSPFPLFHRIED